MKKHYPARVHLWVDMLKAQENVRSIGVLVRTYKPALPDAASDIYPLKGLSGPLTNSKGLGETYTDFFLEPPVPVASFFEGGLARPNATGYIRQALLNSGNHMIRGISGHSFSSIRSLRKSATD